MRIKVDREAMANMVVQAVEHIESVPDEQRVKVAVDSVAQILEQCITLEGPEQEPT